MNLMKYIYLKEMFILITNDAWIKDYIQKNTHTSL